MRQRSLFWRLPGSSGLASMGPWQVLPQFRSRPRYWMIWRHKTTHGRTKLTRQTDPEEDYLTLEEAPLPFIFLTVLLGAALSAAIALGGKIVSVFGFTPAATVIAYSLTFICTDCISELYGKRAANKAVLAGLFAQITAMVLYVSAIHMPSASFWNNQEAFESVLGGSIRITIGSLVAYLASQFHDVWAFHFWRNRTHARHLWLRNNLSTMTSQLIDTVIFITIAFLGVFPVLPVILGQYVVKLGIAILDTPVVYLVVRSVRASARAQT